MDENVGRGTPLHDAVLGPVLLRRGLDDAVQVIRIYSPEPTAAFSRRDSRRPGFPAAVEAAKAAGFTPVLRGPGGRLAAYHRGSVVIDHVLRLPHSQAGLEERFEFFSELHAVVLAGFGVDARVGELDGEYCPGQYSVNAAGVGKIVGSAQRITRDGWLFSSVIQVTGSAALRDVLTVTHRALGYELDASTISAVEDFVPGTTTEVIAETFRHAYAKDAGDVLGELPTDIVQEVQEAAALLEAQLP